MTYKTKFSGIDKVGRTKANEPGEQIPNGCGASDGPGSQSRAHDFSCDGVRRNTHASIVKEFEQGDEGGKDVGAEFEVVGRARGDGGRELTKTACRGPDHENASSTDQVSHCVHSYVLCFGTCKLARNLKGDGP